MYVMWQHEDNILILQIVNLWIDLSGLSFEDFKQFEVLAKIKWSVDEIKFNIHPSDSLVICVGEMKTIN